MKKIAIRLAVATAILSLVVSTALATMESPADSIGKEVRLYLKECATGRPLAFSSGSDLRGIFREGTLIKVTLNTWLGMWYLVESDDVYYWVPVKNIAFIEVIKETG